MPTLLLIEDQAEYRENMSEILMFEGYRVMGAENGEEGVRLATREPPDMIICDLMLPGIDGYEVLRRLRTNPILAHIPFLFLTARVDHFDQRQGMELGADDYLTKPITGAELAKAVKVRLELQQGRERAADKRLNDLRIALADSLPHELLTPLNAVQGFAEMLSLDAERFAPSEIREMADHIRDGARRLHRTIRNFLVFANLKILAEQLEKGAILSGMTLEPAQLVEDVARKTARAVSREDDLEIITGRGTIGFGQEYLEKVVEELVDNSCKFSEPGQKIQIRLVFSGEKAQLIVKDQGRGMSSAEIARMGAFMQFGRDRFEQQGSGLGLAVTRELVRIHGGEMLIEQESPGLRVTLTLPQSGG